MFFHISSEGLQTPHLEGLQALQNGRGRRGQRAGATKAARAAGQGGIPEHHGDRKGRDESSNIAITEAIIDTMMAI